jgi:hypothetical protein
MEIKYCNDGGEQTTKSNNQLETMGQMSTRMTSTNIFLLKLEQAVA